MRNKQTVSHYSLKILPYVKALKSNVWLVSDSKMDGTDAKTPLALMCVLAERSLALFEKGEWRMGFKWRRLSNNNILHLGTYSMT